MFYQSPAGLAPINELQPESSTPKTLKLLFMQKVDGVSHLAPASRSNPTAFQAVSFQQPIPRPRK
jgi:hypothetical protein